MTHAQMEEHSPRMPKRSISPLVLRTPRPSLALGVGVALAAVAAETLAIYPLAHVAPVVSLGVVYLVGVVFISTYWGIQLGFATAPGRRTQLGRTRLVPRRRRRDRAGCRSRPHPRAGGRSAPPRS
jgi:hypothetical protein